MLWILQMCFFCCWFCCTDEEEELRYRRMRRSSSKAFEIPPNADKKCITFLEQVRAKGVTAYEKFAYQQQLRKCSPNSPLLHHHHHTPPIRSPCDKKSYLAFARPSISLSDVSEKTEESLSLSLTRSSDQHCLNDAGGQRKNNSSSGSIRLSSSGSLRDFEENEFEITMNR